MIRSRRARIARRAAQRLPVTQFAPAKRVLSSR
jgi:hypothetical protein